MVFYPSNVILFIKLVCSFPLFTLCIKLNKNYVIYLEKLSHISPMIKTEENHPLETHLHLPTFPSHHPCT